jgi:hypothetical protein
VVLYAQSCGLHIYEYTRVQAPGPPRMQHIQPCSFWCQSERHGFAKSKRRAERNQNKSSRVPSRVRLTFAHTCANTSPQLHLASNHKTVTGSPSLASSFGIGLAPSSSTAHWLPIGSLQARQMLPQCLPGTTWTTLVSSRPYLGATQKRGLLLTIT